MTGLTLFSWGYWGWGNATPRLVEAVDAVEDARGLRPPVFVDVRISRSVRAAGFRDHAFEQLVGKDRYVWMPRLGNSSIKTRTGPPIQIADPSAAPELLQLGLEAAKNQRRLLFFCACERPINDHGQECHRVTVAALVRKAAAARDIAVQTVEWPGGEPESLDLDVSPAILRAVRRGRASLPLPEPVSLARFAGLGWGSIVRLRAGDEELIIITGPASFQGGRWCVLVLQVFEGQEARGLLPRKRAERFRRERGYEPEGVVLRGVSLFPSCIYTIAHLDKLRAILDRGGSGTLTENKPWTSGRKLLEQAHREKLDFPILFADAADCSRLLFWAIITQIESAAEGTRYSFEHLRQLPDDHTPQDLVLLSSGQKIAPGYIRPYALCRTPGFLSKPPERGTSEPRRTGNEEAHG